MPNHCECELMLKGATVDIGLFLAFVRTTKERDGREEEIVFDFDKILPMPESLQIEAGSRGDDGYLALYGTDEQIAEALAWPRWAGLGLTDRAKARASGKDGAGLTAGRQTVQGEPGSVRMHELVRLEYQELGYEVECQRQ